MPDHVHMCISPKHPVASVITHSFHSWSDQPSSGLACPLRRCVRFADSAWSEVSYDLISKRGGEGSPANKLP
jgi:hypothetical protein